MIPLTFAMDIYFAELFLALKCGAIEPELYDEIMVMDLQMMLYSTSLN